MVSEKDFNMVMELLEELDHKQTAYVETSGEWLIIELEGIEININMWNSSINIYDMEKGENIYKN